MAMSNDEIKLVRIQGMFNFASPRIEEGHDMLSREDLLELFYDDVKQILESEV